MADLSSNTPPQSMSLADLIEAARHRKMTPEEIFEQKVSFIWGMQKLSTPGYTQEEIRHLLRAEAPRSESAEPTATYPLVGQLRMHAGASDTHIPRPMLRKAADLIESLQREIDAPLSAARTISPGEAAPDEDSERYRWFRGQGWARRSDIVEAAGDEGHMLDHHIDKGRCGL